MIDPTHPLAEAARTLDALADEHQDINMILEKHGLALGDVLHVAEQRAMRMVLANYGRLDETSPSSPTEIALSPEERALVESLVPVCLDALVIGWKARELATRGEAA